LHFQLPWLLGGDVDEAMKMFHKGLSRKKPAEARIELQRGPR
jgi:hypothetical protein